MKQPLIGMLILASLLFPARLPAQDYTRPIRAAESHMQLLAGVKRIERKTRSRMLAALAPARLTLLSQIAGRLAIAKDPDLDAAARRLNAALSPAEVYAVQSAENDKVAAVNDLVHAAAMPTRPGFRSSPAHVRRAEQVDPGLALIETAMLIRLDQP